MEEFLDHRPKKRIFIGLLVVTCLLLFFLILLVWYVPLVGLRNIHPLYLLSTAFFGSPCPFNGVWGTSLNPHRDQRQRYSL
jgi:hypothetical protein